MRGLGEVSVLVIEQTPIRTVKANEETRQYVSIKRKKRNLQKLTPTKWRYVICLTDNSK